MHGTDTAQAQTMRFCKQGLSLFFMGSRLDDALSAYLHDIDTSDGWGLIDLNGIKFGLDDPESYCFKKLEPGAFVLEGIDPSAIICIAYTKGGMIRQITIRCEACDPSSIIHTLDTAFGKPVVAGTGGVADGTTWSTALWSSTAGFDVFYSGVARSIKLYYPDPDEYKKYQ